MAHSKVFIFTLLFVVISFVFGHQFRVTPIDGFLTAASVSPQAQRILSFYTNITLSGGTNSILPFVDQMAFINATATSMRISMADVEFVRGNEIPVNYQTVLVINEKITVALSRGQNSKSVYSSLTSAMSHAVIDQSFTDQLLYVSKIYGANETLSCAAYNVTYYDFVDPGNSASRKSCSYFAVFVLLIGLMMSIHR